MAKPAFESAFANQRSKGPTQTRGCSGRLPATGCANAEAKPGLPGRRGAARCRGPTRSQASRAAPSKSALTKALANAALPSACESPAAFNCLNAGLSRTADGDDFASALVSAWLPRAAATPGVESAAASRGDEAPGKALDPRQEAETGLASAAARPRRTQRRAQRAGARAPEAKPGALPPPGTRRSPAPAAAPGSPAPGRPAGQGGAQFGAPSAARVASLDSSWRTLPSRIIWSNSIALDEGLGARIAERDIFVGNLRRLIALRCADRAFSALPSAAGCP